MTQRLFFSLTIIIFSFSAFAQEKYTINGYLKDAKNGENLIGATVYVKEVESGTATNFYGFYSITLPAGDYTLAFRSLGYSVVDRSIQLDQNLRIDIELQSEGIELEEVVITDRPEDENIVDIEMSVEKLDISTIQKLPPFLGETDVIKSIQLLPGVSTVGEGASGFNVRGGSVGQNLILLDEAPIYNSSHLFGFFSVFNPDVVQDVKLYKGGVPAKYGGRISSVLDVRMKEGNKKKVGVNGGIGTVFSRLTVEGPIQKDKTSFVIAARRSYADVFARLFTDILDDGAALNFYDINLKVNSTINKRNRIFLSGYFGRDVFRQDSRQGFNWGNQSGTFRWNHLFNDRWFSNFSVIYAQYDYGLAFGESDFDSFDWDSEIETWTFKPEFTYFANTNNELTIGGEVTNYTFEPANAVAISSGEVSDISVPTKRAIESAVYIENEQKISDKLTLKYGLRVSNFLYLGETTVFEFEENRVPGERRELVSERQADDWEVIESYTEPEPRIALNYRLNNRSSIKASYNRTAQYIHLVSNTVAATPIDVWTPSSNNIRPQTGQQVALGYFRNFQDNGFETSVEAYYRPTDNQVEYVDGADIFINERIEGDLIQGRGRAYGLEFSVRKNIGRLTGFGSYTLSRSELLVDGINNNDWYPTRFDQTHNLTLSAFYELNERLTLSSTFTYITGTPATFPNGRFEQRLVGDIAIPYLEDDQRNNVRIQDYNRLDLSLTIDGKKFKRGEKRKNEDYWVISIYNVYGRRNAFSQYFGQDLDVREVDANQLNAQTFANRFSVIGTIFPSVSYNFKF
ncbi:MAG: TonB-dependent receptor [Bacteroidota bacterium]